MLDHLPLAVHLCGAPHGAGRGVRGRAAGEGLAAILEREDAGLARGADGFAGSCEENLLHSGQKLIIKNDALS